MLNLIAIALIAVTIPASFAIGSETNNPKNPVKLWEDNQVILDGTITQIHEYDKRYEYHIDVNYYFKTPYKFDSIIAYGDIQYKKGDRVLFLLYDNGKNFQVSKYSMDITKECKQKEGLLFLAVPNSRLGNTKEFPRVITTDTCLPENFILLDKETIELSILLEPPLRQKFVGITDENIICHDEKMLIFKASDGSPACVKPKTAEKLVERGWALG